jgi:hypothetical protein
VNAFCQDNNPVSASTVHKALFTNYSYLFRTQKWFNIARNDVVGLSETSPLVSLFVGWLVGLIKLSVVVLSEEEIMEWK